MKRRGDVYACDLRAVGASDQGWGVRPAIVVSNDFFNQRLDTVVVVTLTARTERAEQAGCVLVPKAAVQGAPGLPKDSVAVCHSPLTVFEELLTERLGSVSDEVLSEIDEVVAFVLGV